MADNEILDNAKTLRSNQADAEQRLWYHLRAHRFMNLKFKRQKPIGSFIVDFVCVERMLIVEMDGGQHAEQVEYDQRRDAWLRCEGYTVLRFWNNEVMQQMEGVLEQIRLAVVGEPSPPAPLPQAGEGRKESRHAASCHRHHIENALDHPVLVDAGSFRLKRQDDAVTQHIEQHGLNVFRADEITPSQPGMGA